MIVRPAAVVLALVMPVAAGACNKSKPPTAATAQQLAAAIAARGAGCQDFAASDTASAAGSINASSGACTVRGKRVALAVYQSSAERDKGQVELLKGCIGRRALNPNSTGTWAFAKGPTWVVLGADHESVITVGKALHTSVQTSPC